MLAVNETPSATGKTSPEVCARLGSNGCAINVFPRRNSRWLAPNTTLERIRENAPLLTAVQRTEIDAILFPRRSDLRVQKMMAIGQKYRETGEALGFGHVGGDAADRRNSLDYNLAAGRRKYDHVVAAPRSAAAVGCVA